MRSSCSIFLVSVGVCLSCNGSLAEPGEVEDDGADGAVGASGGSLAGEASGGAANRDARQARKDTRGERPDMSSGGAGAGFGGAGIGGATPDDEKPIPVPSPACSLPASVPEDHKLDLAIELGSMPVSLPPGYDGSSPGPIIVAFPASNDGLPELVDDRRMPNPLLEHYIIARPRPFNTTSSTWEGQEIEDYDAVYRELAAHVCFDEARVIGVGNGGGARFLIRMAGQPASQEVVRPSDFIAMAVSGPVSHRVEPGPHSPLLFIHSTNDERGRHLWGDPNGAIALGKRRDNKECNKKPVPMAPNSYYDVSYVCWDFTGCTSPLRFCSHEQPTRFDLWETRHNFELHRFFAQYL